VLFSVTAQESYVFALTRDGFDWKAIPVGGQALAEKVAAFRRGLNVNDLHRGLERLECTQIEGDKRGLSRVECGQVLAKECEEAERRGLARTDCATVQSRRGLFDLGLAHELYETLLGPVEALIRDHRNCCFGCRYAEPSRSVQECWGPDQYKRIRAVSCGYRHRQSIRSQRHMVSFWPRASR
jgi:hypothetical protein